MEEAAEGKRVFLNICCVHHPSRAFGATAIIIPKGRSSFGSHGSDDGQAPAGSAYGPIMDARCQDADSSFFFSPADRRQPPTSSTCVGISIQWRRLLLSSARHFLKYTIFFHGLQGFTAKV